MAAGSFNPHNILRSQSSRKLYDNEIIDKQTKAMVRRVKGYEGADTMIDYVLSKLETQPMLFDKVISLMKEIELLTTVAAELEKASSSGLPADVVSTDGPTKAKMLPSKILKKHMTDLLDIIGDPNKLATDLHNESLISGSVVDEVLTTTGLSRYTRASKVVNDFQRQLNVFDEQESLVKFCQVLKKQGDSILERKAKEMLYEL